MSMFRVATGLVMLGLAVSGCLPTDGGGGSGGGGGTSAVTFTSGYAFVRKDDRNLYVANSSDLSTVGQVTTSGDVHQPSLSADGKRIVFALQDPSTNVSAIATVGSSGGTVSTVLSTTTTPQVTNLRNPVFSPDGTRIVFGFDQGAGASLGVVNTDGSGFATLAGGSLSYGSPSFYPDGTAVLAGAGSGTLQLNQIERVDLATGMSTNVTSTLGNEAENINTRVVISPDGTKAAFDAKLSNGGSRIFVIDLSTKTITRMTDYPADPNAQDTFPAWVGSTQVTFSSDSGGSDQVYSLPSTSVMTSGGLVLPSALEPWYGPN